MQEKATVSFRFALFNGLGAALSATAGNCIVKYRTYNMNLNNHGGARVIVLPDVSVPSP